MNARRMLAAALRVESPWVATLMYTVVSVAFTWPLAAGLAHDIPWDLGDSVFNCWILGWNAHVFGEVLSGEPGAIAQLWHGNIFHPQPLSIAYSELLLPQSLAAFPVIAATGNLVLAHNLLYLATFVLSGLGMYLFARDLTGDAYAAFLAGLLFAFMPYRVEQGSHLQVLSVQWMPFALLGLRRFVATGAARPLVWAVIALVAQSLSCGYYLLYFGLFVPFYVVHELASRGRLADWRPWVSLSVAGTATAALVVPYMLPYLELRAMTGHHRELVEIRSFSADLLGYLTADEHLHLLGTRLRTFPIPEGDLFPGVVMLLLAGVGLVAAARSSWKEAGDDGAPPAARWRDWLPAPWRHQALLVVLGVTALLAGVLWVAYGLGLPTRFNIGPIAVRNRDVVRPAAIFIVALTALLLLAPRLRRAGFRWLRTDACVCAALAAAAIYLSLGPEPKLGGAPMRVFGPYRWLFDHVPGFDGLRVPARLAMTTMVFLTIGAGLGAAALLRWTRRAGAITAVLAVAMLAEAWVAPISTNRVIRFTDEQPPPWPLRVANDVPPVYRYLAGLPKGSALIEFPFGDVGWDLHAVYYSTMHWQRIVNGFSGGFPPWYPEMVTLLKDVTRNPDAAWRAVSRLQPTHAVVHAAAFSEVNPRSPESWLLERGARLTFNSRDARVYLLPMTGGSPAVAATAQR